MLAARLLGTSFVCWLLICNNSCLRAEIKPHGLFTDNAVLQRGVKLPVWGITDKKDTVKVSFAGQEVSAQPIEGKWRVEFTPLEASSNPATLTITQGDEKLELKNILIGDVWLCGGQSNMALPLDGVENGKEALAKSDNSQLRLYREKIRIGALEPLSDVPQPPTGPNRTWLEAGPESAKEFSAVGYFFGRDIQKSLGVPIGMIHANMGSTTAERWISKDYIEANAVLKEMKPTEGVNDLWNGMIFPLTQFPIKGVLWYQGEANTKRAWQYRTLLVELVNNWRNAWRNSNLPFLIVQLAPFMENEPNSTWAELRDSQRHVSQSINNSGLAVTIDLGDKTDIHPKRKREVGERLALVAKALVYGQKIPYSGPIFDKLAIHADNAVLTFKHVGSGLVAKDGELRGFTVAGEDGKFYDAKAEIVGDTVIVWSDKVRRARAVRYGWSNYPEVNLWNKDGLPASPFRTDDYPLSTQDNK